MSYDVDGQVADELSSCCGVTCAGDHLIKLSISHALSQSTKLCVFEERVIEIVASTKDLPEILASTGPPSVL